MEPNQIPTQAEGQSSQPQSNNQDPSVLALTKTIGTLESGGDYESGDGTGDGAASSGAYQMTPAFLENWAPKAGVSYTPGETLTPQQQDQIAMDTVKTLGTTGLNGTPLTPQQIISYWNTGGANNYLDPNYGENNSYGSTANEVAKGVSLYNQYMNPSSQGTTASTQSGATSSNSSTGNDWLETALGAGAAILGGLWGYAQKPITDAAVDAGIGAIGGPEGALAGAGTGVVQGIAQDFFGGGNNTNSQTSGTSDDSSSSSNQSQPDINAGDSSGSNPEDQQLVNNAINASRTVGQGTNQAMQGTQTNRAYAQTPEGQQGMAAMAENGYVPEIGEQGEMDYSGAMKEASANESKAAEVEGMAAGNGQVPLADVINSATQSLQNDERMTPGTRKSAQEYAGQYAREYANSNGSISAQDAIKARQQQYKEVSGANWTKLSSAQIEARKAVGKALRAASLKHSENPELQEAAIKEQQKHINAKKVMKRLHQKKAPKQNGMWERFLRQGARAVEIYIGEKIGGPVGAILGGLVGEHFNNKLSKHFGKNIFEKKGMKAAMDVLRDTKPDIYEKLVARLKKEGVRVPKDQSKEPSTEEGKVQAVKKDEKKLVKGLVDIPSSGAKSGEREIKDDEIMPAGKRIRFDMKTGKKYVSD